MKPVPAHFLALIALLLMSACRQSVPVQLPPFHWAAARGNVEQVLGMLKAGQDVNDLSPTGKTALMYAAGALLNDSERDYPERQADLGMHENINVVEVLLQAGADLNLRAEGTGETALSLAVYHGRSATVRKLLQNGANPDLGAFQMSPLEVAAARCYPDIAALLLSRNADATAAKDEAKRHHCKAVTDLINNANTK